MVRAPIVMGCVPVREQVSAMVLAGEMWRGGFAGGGCAVWEGWGWEEGRRLVGCALGDRVVVGFGVDMEVGLEECVEIGRCYVLGSGEALIM